ncbi:3'-5' exonuclease [Helicobacter saguini]|uniref:3'-5' exonuclease n=1 Tax=Helicobacter saguini TaxID=1548018 RepID=A0A347VJC2_9HELI|nr:3'-5' exonuclease [Helicobacter saguini]MWV63034.1 3'-5' exonuclease [Helicobacter saguini]MWV66297.1 3'-5' exonuclease [Helicobacter saguini]MWV68649.1 3'-5' exonuclease [Helicobacter saguini]MWV71800.1 3'-5' exonuclease [Helicobacter saguini]TLD95827.1 3'-5' exonuclease [Helicobacter saguini]
MLNNKYDRYFALCDNLPLDIESFCDEITQIFSEYDGLENDCIIEVMIGNNAPFFRTKDNKIDINTKIKTLQDSTLCFVDIEATGTKNVQSGQIIEIGALKVRNNEIIDTFESFVYSPYVPEDIVALTGITSYMLENAPKIGRVLKDFRIFLADSVFVAHNVSFDYNFISDSLAYYGLPCLLNARFCTVDLSRRVIPSTKHSLSFLNEMLGINNFTSHRALADAITSYEIYKICTLSLPKSIESAQDLINFSKGKITYPKRATSKNTLTKHTSKYELGNAI